MSKLSLVHLVHVERHGDQYGHLRADRSRSISSTVTGKRTRDFAPTVAVAGQNDRCWMKSRIPFDLPIAGRRKVGSRRTVTMFTTRNVRGIRRGAEYPRPFVQRTSRCPPDIALRQTNETPLFTAAEMSVISNSRFPRSASKNRVF